MELLNDVTLAIQSLKKGLVPPEVDVGKIGNMAARSKRKIEEKMAK